MESTVTTTSNNSRHYDIMIFLEYAEAVVRMCSMKKLF